MGMGKVSKVYYGYGKDNTEWETDKDFFEKLNNIFNFNLDCCATRKNKKCKKYYTKKDNALEQDWNGRVFMNPPYGRKINLWIKKAAEEVRKGNAEIVVCLIPVRTDSYWFYKYAKLAQVVFLHKRLRFSNIGNSPFGSMLLIFRKNWKKKGIFLTWNWKK